MDGFFFSIKALTTNNNEKGNDKNTESEQHKRLDYLLKQAEVYSHFVTKGSKASKSTEPENKRKRKVLTSVQSESINK